MPIAAVPAYLGNDFKQASPGMRFNMLLPLWGIDRKSGEVLWGHKDTDYQIRGQYNEERMVDLDNTGHAIGQACPLNKSDQALMQALGRRQEQLARSTHDVFSLQATSVAPFATGLGIDHPLENGFAFLDPYGLPYLPASSTKGVLRAAVLELASGQWGQGHGWSEEKKHELFPNSRQAVYLSDIDVMFGLESEDGDRVHVRGALSFWDVIPQIVGNSLQIEIMTPHQSHYLQGSKSGKGSTSPHDSGQPNPICFLAVPPGTGFYFHVQCDLNHMSRLAPALAENGLWKELLSAAFEHAFGWLGFGAKTAVGYGAMESEQGKMVRMQNQLEQEQARVAQQKAAEEVRLQENAEQWSGAQISLRKASGTLTVKKGGREAHAMGEKAQQLLEKLPPGLLQKVRSSQFARADVLVAEGVLLDVISS